MNAIAIRTAGARAGFVSSVAARLSLWLRRREAYARTVNELEVLTDRDLSDLGIARCDIRRLAREAADRV
ncbi:MAG: DUF1127 domain-containing protein [Rubrimonas sp.]